MKKMLAVMVLALSLMFSVNVLKVNAEEYRGYIDNYWVNSNGEYAYYIQSNNGKCGSTVYILKTNNPVVSNLKLSLMFAISKDYMVSMVVTSCSGNYNIIDFAKICNNPDSC